LIKSLIARTAIAGQDPAITTNAQCTELSAPDNALSAQGWIALTLGILGTAPVAGILMWLLFQSDRRGYDR
jgi:hypothetical protein